MYRKASIAWPFTWESLGNWISRGAESDAEGSFDEDFRPNVLARGRSKEVEVAGALRGDVGDDVLKDECVGERPTDVSYEADWLREAIGTVKFCRFELGAFVELEE